MGWMPGWFKSILNMVTYRAIQGGRESGAIYVSKTGCKRSVSGTRICGCFAGKASQENDWKEDERNVMRKT